MPVTAKPARHTAHGQPWAGVWFGAAMRSNAQLCAVRQSLASHSRHTAAIRGGCSLVRTGAAVRIRTKPGAALFGGARRSNARQTHRIRSRVRQSASHGQAMLGVAGPVLANTPRIFGCAEVCTAWQRKAWRGEAMLHTPRIRESARKWSSEKQGSSLPCWVRRGLSVLCRHTAASDGRCSLRCNGWPGEARHGDAMLVLA